jgi:photosystem II stability/assembly factor-like uncharacterized protein
MRFLALWFAGLIVGSAPAFFSANAATALKNTAVDENFYGVDIIDDQAWVVGYYGTILHSKNRGQSWEVQPAPTQSALFSVRFTSQLDGWISGSYGTVLHTTDGGKTWRAQPAGTTEHLFASYWLDENQGGMVGSRGTTLRTVDGGRSWSSSIVPGDITFSGVQFTSAAQGWMVGEFGVIFHTSDGGKNWLKQKSPVEVSFSSGASQNLFGVLFLKPTEGYAFGLDGVVLKTSDGKRWEVARPSETVDSSNGASNHLFAAAAFNDRISIVGERGTLLQLSPDTGKWRQADVHIPRVSLNGIAFGKNGFGLAVGNRGLILRTDDGGKSWKRLKINPQLAGKEIPHSP